MKANLLRNYNINNNNFMLKYKTQTISSRHFRCLTMFILYVYVCCI